MIQAFRRRAFFYPDPLDLGPVLDRRVVALEGTSSRTLATPAQPREDPPDVTWVVGDAGQALDDFADAGQCPEVGGKPVREWPLQEFALEPREVPLVQSRQTAGPAGTAQRGRASLGPFGVPAARALA